jgi:transcription antitermination factor NusA-like protein
MANTIDMQDMRYLNLFEKIMKIRTRFCFKYNETIVFCVPKHLVHRAVGPDARNIRRMSQILRKKIKVVAVPKGSKDVKLFLTAVVSPTKFKGIEIKDNEVIISGGSNKAALIGRNKRRLTEMQKIIKNFFGKEYRII